MAKLNLALLGGFQARLEAGAALVLPTRKAQALLAYLALPPGQAHPRDKLAALLWGGIREESARASLRQALFAIRKALGADAVAVLRQEGDLVALNPVAVEVDVANFERAVVLETAESLARAADLYRGDLLAGLGVDETPFEEWLIGERERLRELALEGVAKLLAHQRRGGAMAAAVGSALRLLTLDPLQEAVHRTLMRLYADLGRRGAALRQYQQCVTVLQRELGTAPEAETKQLYQEILQRRPSAAVVEAVEDVRIDETSASPGMLVGRDAEFATLRALLDEAAARSVRMVALVGDAGIGKSRLATALTAAARARRARAIVGRCYENERMLPFAPWIDAFRAARLTPDDADLRVLEPVWRAELARLLPELAPLDLPPSDDRTRLFEAVTRLVEALAVRSPLVILLEDVHWADDASMGLLGYVRRHLHGARVLIAVTARAEELAETAVVRQTLEDLQDQQRLVRLALAPLDRQDTLALVHATARTDGDPPTWERLGEDIWTASEGNPFMVVETIRALEQGAGGAIPRPLPLPEKVRHVISRRLERLGHHARELTVVAAVIGRAVDFPVLQQAAGLGEADAAAAVEELVRRRVLHGVGERFDFTHDRIREVAYDALLMPRRRLLHRHVAEALEAFVAVDRDPHALALARHYREAGVWDKAVASFRQAGAYAMSRAGYREAVACLEQALEALGHVAAGRETTEIAVDIRLELRTALYPLGEFGRTLAYLREAQPLAEQLHDGRRLGRVSAYLCVAFRRLGDFEGAIAAGERTLSLAAAIDDLPLQVATTLYLAQALWFSGAGRRAVEVFRRNVTSLTSDQLRQQFGAPGHPAVFSMTDMATVLAELGEFDEAKSVGAQGLAVAEELAHPFTSIAAYLAMASVSIAGGEFAKAITRLERARSLCDGGDFPVQRVSALARLGYAYVRTGRLVDGLGLLEGAAQHVDRIDGYWRPTLLGWLSEGYLLAGRVEDAARVADRAQTLTPGNAPSVRASMLRLAAEVASHSAQVDVDRAAGLYREAAALADALDLRLLRAHCHLGLGRLYRSAGDPRGRVELSAAVDAFRSMGVAYLLSIAESELLSA